MSRRIDFIKPLRVLLLCLALAFPAAAEARSRNPAPDSDDETGQNQPFAAYTGSQAPKVRAASVVVIDAKTGKVLYEKNADERRPAASTQKLLTALIVAEAGDLDKRVTVEPTDTDVEPVKLNFRPGETYTRRELLTILLVHSMNDVARCLARDNAGSIEAFAARMNRKAAELGMTNSHFVNPNGLPIPDQYSCARDMAKVAQADYANPFIRSIVCLKSYVFHYADGRPREYKNTNRVLLNYAACNGMKTGYTEAAGHCLIASGAENGRDIIAVVLGDSSGSIWKDAYMLLAWGLSS